MMTKRKLYLIYTSLAVLASILFACTSSQNTRDLMPENKNIIQYVIDPSYKLNGYETYINKDYGFILQYPQDWEVIPPNENFHSFQLLPRSLDVKDPLLTVIDVKIFNNNMTLDERMNSDLQEFKRSQNGYAPNFKILDDTVPSSYWDRRIWFHSYLVGDDGYGCELLKQTTSKYYSISCWSPDNNYPFEIFDKVASSFNILEEAPPQPIKVANHDSILPPSLTSSSTSSPQPTTHSRIPVIETDDRFKVYLGSPPNGKYLTSQYAHYWLDPRMGGSKDTGYWITNPDNGQRTQIPTTSTSEHYNPKFTMMYSWRYTYRDFGIPLEVGDYMLPSEYFCHNVPYTLWSINEGWYIPTLDRDSFGILLYYLSKHPTDDVNNNNRSGWYLVTAADLQEWRIQDLEDKVNSLEQQRQY